MATKKANPAFMKPHNLSPELEAVVGKGPLSRPEITSKLWEYIKAHDLQNPKNKRNVLADAKLEAVFGKKEATMFEMAGFVSKHLLD